VRRSIGWINRELAKEKSWKVMKWKKCFSMAPWLENHWILIWCILE
jgi:hypothetical protein